MAENKPLAIGIDLGTTFIVLLVYGKMVKLKL